MFDILKLLAVATVAGIGWTIGSRLGGNMCDYVADATSLPRRLVDQAANLFRSKVGREPTTDELMSIAAAVKAG